MEKTLKQEVKEQIEYHEWLLSHTGILEQSYKDTEELISLFKRIEEALNE